MTCPACTSRQGITLRANICPSSGPKAEFLKPKVGRKFATAPRLAFPTVHATVVSSALTRAFVGEGPIYGQREFHLRSPSELLAYAGLGIATALCFEAVLKAIDGARALPRAAELFGEARKTAEACRNRSLDGLVADGLVEPLPGGSYRLPLT